jgi:hypothetical protein
LSRFGEFHIRMNVRARFSRASRGDTPGFRGILQLAVVARAFQCGHGSSEWSAQDVCAIDESVSNAGETDNSEGECDPHSVITRVCSQCRERYVAVSVSRDRAHDSRVFGHRYRLIKCHRCNSQLRKSLSFNCSYPKTLVTFGFVQCLPASAVDISKSFVTWLEPAHDVEQSLVAFVSAR